MGRTPLLHLDGPRVYACAVCGAHLARYARIISKSFTGRRGRAYLFAACVNTRTGLREDRMLMTGLHTVADTYCVGCGTCVGWTYLEAFEASQKYKEGRFIIEKAAMRKVHWTDSAPAPVGMSADERFHEERVLGIAGVARTPLSSLDPPAPSSASIPMPGTRVVSIV